MSTIQEIWHPPHSSSAMLLHAAAHVCEFSDNQAGRAIERFLKSRDIKVHHRPVTVLGKNVTYCIYHLGGEYAIYAMGDPEHILQASLLSENDREKSLLEARRLGKNETIVLGIAKGTLSTLPQSTRAITGLQFCGHISVV